MRHSMPARVAGWFGLAAHLVLAVWYAASGLVAPGWAVAILLTVWAALMAYAIVLLRRRPAWVVAVPIAGMLIWLVAISAGDAWLGWTA